MLSKVLIANRGEIALRVIRACRELGIKAAAVYSEADVNSLHVRYADEAHLIGSPPPSESYLNIKRITETAVKAGADAVHPGYGFLAENANLAEACEKKHLTFVGPSSSTLKITGNKLECRKRMIEAGVPVLPGGSDLMKDESQALDVAEQIGWPVLIKSVYGGGGRGIRVAYSEKELLEVFEAAQREALAAFGRFGVYIEKFLESPRHIEFQILADRFGNVVHLGERECSIQRRFQKLLELSPSPVVDARTRRRVGRFATTAAKAVRYTNAGTIEFVRDGDGRFFFIEVNARLQVEHPVTEMVTGMDLVKQQFRIAGGEGLPFTQGGIRLNGCAVECRINAEDPVNDFSPSVGLVSGYHPPHGPGVRFDTALYPSYEIPVYYDSLIGKLITWGRDFEEARLRMRNGLKDLTIEGIKTTIPMHRLIVEDEGFISGRLSTTFLQDRRILERVVKREREEYLRKEEVAVAAAAIYPHLRGKAASTPLAPRAEAGRARWRDQDVQPSPSKKSWRYADYA